MPLLSGARRPLLLASVGRLREGVWVLWPVRVEDTPWLWGWGGDRKP